MQSEIKGTCLILIATSDGDVIQVATDNLYSLSITSSRGYAMDVFSFDGDSTPKLVDRNRLPRDQHGRKGPSAVDLTLSCGQTLPQWAQEADDP